MSFDDQLNHALREAAEDALMVAAHAIAERAKQLMPVGDPDVDPDPNVSLRESVNIRREGPAVIVSVDTPYAAKAEFDLRLKHPRSGGPRFLHRAVQEVAPSLAEIVAGKTRGRVQ